MAFLWVDKSPINQLFIIKSTNFISGGVSSTVHIQISRTGVYFLFLIPRWKSFNLWHKKHKYSVRQMTFLPYFTVFKGGYQYPTKIQFNSNIFSCLGLKISELKIENAENIRIVHRVTRKFWHLLNRFLWRAENIR